MNLRFMSVVTLLVIVSGCNTRDVMVGAGAEVTGGRVFRFGFFRQTEQQMLMELQSISVEPGQIIRAGGFGRYASGFIIEFGEETMWRVEEYSSSVTSQELGAIMTNLATVDATAARVAQATIHLANARQHLSEAKEAMRKAAEAKDRNERIDVNKTIKDVLKRGVPTEAALSAVEAVPVPTEELDGTKAELNPAQDAVGDAETSLKDAKTDLKKAQEDLECGLASHENVWIFRAKDMRKSSGSIRAGELASVSASRESEESVLVVVAGLRRIRLVVGKDYGTKYKEIDETGALMRWPAAYRTTGPVTHVLQVQRLRYFTEGSRRATIEAMAAMTPKYFTQLSAMDLLELQLDLRFAADAFSSYENRGSLGDPEVWTYYPYCEPSVSNKKPNPKWMTLTATTTHLNYLRKQGRITR